jgi:hypothetical protein
MAVLFACVGLTACMQDTQSSGACPPDAGLGCGNELVEPVVRVDEDDIFMGDPVTIARIEALDDAALSRAVAASWVAIGCTVVKGQGATTAAAYEALRMALADQLGLDQTQRSGSANAEQLDWALEDGDAILAAAGRLVEDGESTRLVPCAA